MLLTCDEQTVFRFDGSASNGLGSGASGGDGTTGRFLSIRRFRRAVSGVCLGRNGCDAAAAVPGLWRGIFEGLASVCTTGTECSGAFLIDLKVGVKLGKVGTGDGPT